MRLALRVGMIGLLMLPMTGGAEPSADASVEVAFSPNAGAEQLVIKVIAGARESIRLAAYRFTSKPVAEALVAAHRRGVSVQAVMDRSEETARYTGARFLVHAGIAVRIDRRHAIMHNKFLVVDGRHLETGSFNFTRAADDKNAENVLVVWNDPEVARRYLENWAEHWQHSTPYRER